MSQASPLTPSSGFLRRVLHGSRELKRAPRKSRSFAATPKSTRGATSSPLCDRSETESPLTPFAALLTPSTRGSPMLTSRNSTSPRLSPKTGKTPLGSLSAPKSPTKYRGDRFIPTRSKTDFDQSNFLLLNGSPYKSRTPVQHTQIPTIRVLAFGNESPKGDCTKETESSIGAYNLPSVKEEKNPERILDAPGVFKDQGNNLLDWSARNLLALALENTVYLWHSATHKTELLCRTPSFTYVIGLQWNRDGSVLAVAVSDKKIHFWNCDTGITTLCFTGYTLSTLAWNGPFLTCGSLYGKIGHIDTRNCKSEERGCFFTAHDCEVTCLAWNQSGQLLASGCEDGVLAIWTGNDSIPMHYLQDKLSEIMACQWSSFMNAVLAIGRRNGSLSVWRFSDTDTKLSEIDTGSTVKDVKWVSTPKGIFTGHSNGDVNFFKYPLLNNVKRFKGHEGMVISLSMAPDYRSLVSLGADETLRIWNIGQADNIKQSPSTFSRQLLR